MTTTLAQREAELRRKADDLAAERAKNDEARHRAVREAAIAAAHAAYAEANGSYRAALAKAYAELEAAEQTLDKSVIYAAFVNYEKARLAQNAAERTAVALLDEYDPNVPNVELWTYHTDADGNQMYDDNGSPLRTMNPQPVDLKANGQRPRAMPAPAIPADFSDYMNAVVRKHTASATAEADAAMRALVNNASTAAAKPYEK